jgi:hypothetical protein
MKILTKYSKNGYDFTIVKREGDLAIAKGHSRNSEAVNWEVIEIQSHDGLKMGDAFVAPAEFAPSNNQWGNKGWTAWNEDHAHEVFAKRQREYSARKQKCE